MGLFDKKYCDICGEKIGLLGNRKLEDGNLCKNCAAKLSPWFDERRHSTVEEIKEQLEYRENNKAAVEAFNTTRTFGENWILHLDEESDKFLIARTSNIKNENPDVLDCSQVTGCDVDVDMRKSECKKKLDNGEQVSYNPPRYNFYYDYYINLRVNHKYIDDMRFKLNNRSVEFDDVTVRTGQVVDPSLGSPECQRYAAMGEEVKTALMNVRQQIRDEMIEAKKPKATVVCPHCGATTTPDKYNKCEFCGSSIPQS